MGLRWNIRTLAHVETLDIDDLRAGYWEGFNGEPEPGDNRSPSFWHGWRNGAVDGSYREKDVDQAAIAREAIQANALGRMLGIDKAEGL